MRFLCFILLFITFSLTAFSQTDSTKIGFVAYWSKGDSYDFIVSKVEKKWKKGELEKNDSSRYMANFLVIDSTENSYTIQWTMKDFWKNNTENNVLEYFENSSELISILLEHDFTKIIYETDELGELKEVLNWKEITDGLNKIFEKVFDKLKSSSPSEKEDDIRENLKRLFANLSSKEAILSHFYPELTIFHFPMSYEFETDKPIEFEQEFPNGFSDELFIGDSVLTFLEVDYENYICYFSEEVKVREDDVRGFLKNFFQTMNLNDEKAEEVIETSKIDMNDFNVYAYAWDPCIPIYIKTSRNTEFDFGDLKIDSYNAIYIEMI